MSYSNAPTTPRDDDTRYRELRTVTLVGSVVDVLLALGKVSGGLITQSQALIADGIHSFSDLVTDLFVLFAAKKASHQADLEHPYGHGRIQAIATAVLAVSLALVAVGICWDALARLRGSNVLLQPGWGALGIATASVVLKEGVYQYTIRAAARLESHLLRANAWHSRSDALSSLVVIAGVIGVLAGYSWADAAAAIGVAAMILYVAYRIGKEAVDELIDTAVDPATQAEIRKTINNIPGVLDAHELRTRRMGSQVLADVHIRVAPLISVSEGHRIGDEVLQILKQRFRSLTDVIVHVDPEDDTVSAGVNTLALRPEIEQSVKQILIRHGLSEWEIGGLHYTNLVLHFLKTEIQAQLTLPLPSQDTRSSIEAKASTIAQDIIGSTQIDTLEVLFSADLEYHAKPGE